MTIKFKILSVNESEHSIVVKYFDDVMTEEIVENRTTFNLDLPVPTPTGQYLNEYIVRHAPAQFFINAAAVKTQSVDLSEIHSLVGVELQHPHPQKEALKKKQEIKYEILSFSPSHATAIVRYYTDAVPNGLTLNVGLPLVNGQHPDEIMTDKFIMDVAPVAELTRLEVHLNEPPAIPLHLEDKVVIHKEFTKEEVRMEEIQRELVALDLKKIRYLATNDKKMLATLNAETAVLVDEYRTLKAAV